MSKARSWLMVGALAALIGHSGCNCCCSTKQTKANPPFSPGPMGSAATPTGTTNGVASTGTPTGGRMGQTAANPTSDALTPTGPMPRSGAVATNAGMVNMTTGSATDPVKSWDGTGSGKVTQTGATSVPGTSPAPGAVEPTSSAPTGTSLPMTMNTMPPPPDMPTSNSARYIPTGTSAKPGEARVNSAGGEVHSIPSVQQPREPVDLTAPPPMPLSSVLPMNPAPPAPPALPMNPTIPSGEAPPITPVTPMNPSGPVPPIPPG